jgi:hypothetical protein
MVGQMDTLLSEDFQDLVLDPEPVIFPEGSNDTWVNWDADALPAAQSRDGDWFLDVDQYQLEVSDSIAPTDTNFVFGSSSWLEGFEPGNRNWLITPPITIVDDQATFHWQSASFQGPRYHDGCSILVSTGENFESSFTDTLYRTAQMIEPLPAGASDVEINAFNVDSFFFAPAGAYVQADRYTNDAFFLADTASALYLGRLEPFSVSLADYAGQTIYIAIVHDSDDDNLIFIDDLLVLGTDPLTTVDEPSPSGIRLVTYPNPATNFLNVLFRLDEAAAVTLEAFDIQGQRVKSLQPQQLPIGEQTMRLNVSQLPSGTYNIVLTINDVRYVRPIVKQ